MGYVETQTCAACGMQGLVCTHLPAVAQGFGNGEVVPESFMQRVEGQFRAEVERREAETRAALTARVREALESQLAGEFVDPDDGESMQRAADVAVEVFVEFLRTPLPVHEDPSVGR